MKKNHRPTTTSLQEFVAEFNGKQRAEIQRELDYYDFLTAFKEARKSIPLTQEELARKSGVNRTTLSKIESGSRNATVDTLMRLADALQMRFTIRLSA
jgi:UDP-N-acetylglucosamine 1-carboxyvinyltransferase